MAVFGKREEQEQEQEGTDATLASQEAVVAPCLGQGVSRALASIIKTVDMFKDTAQDVLEAEQNTDVSAAELKDLVSRCKSYSIIVEKEFKIMRRRMQAK
ncbi:MAG: hypothetical protein DRJ03_01930 [Chloroflexi bacterium]|nr:MAG: hypothetical protein DRJ03_01930 [Chloroflexota bacterium]